MKWPKKYPKEAPRIEPKLHIKANLKIFFGFPIQRALKKTGKVKVAFVNPEHSLTRSQDLEKMYHDAGQFYWFHCEKCLDNKELIGKNAGSIIISEIEGQDIDNLTDWKLAEIKYETLQKLN